MMLVSEPKDELEASQLAGDGKIQYVLLGCWVSKPTCRPVCVPPRGQSHFASLQDAVEEPHETPIVHHVTDKDDNNFDETQCNFVLLNDGSFDLSSFNLLSLGI